MTTTEATPPAAPTTADAKPLHYRYSVLITAIGRFFRGFVPFAVVIAFNALVQMVLIWIFDPLPGWNAPFIIATVISFVVLLWAFHALNVTALAVATGKTSLIAVAKSGKNWLAFSLWTVAMYVLVLIAMFVSTWLALAVLAILAFVPMAAADGKRNPIVTNFKVIGERWLRYVITAVILGALLVFSTLMSGINGFFIGGNLGSIIVWLFWGITAAWYLNALALIYRSTNTGAETEDSSSTTIAD